MLRDPAWRRPISVLIGLLVLALGGLMEVAGVLLEHRGRR